MNNICIYYIILSIRFLQRVENRTAETLLPLIQQWVVPGARIHSDCWAAYNGLAQLGYRHETVNHRENFRDPITGATTNHVEAFWSRIKRDFKSVLGSQGELKWSRLDEACYRHWFSFKSDTPIENFNRFLGHVATAYPVE